MSRKRDQPDPSNIRSSQRSRLRSSKLMDPKNGEAPSAPHQNLVGETIATSVSLISDLVDKIEALARLVPNSIHTGTDQEKIYHVINIVSGFDKNSTSSTFTRRMDILFGHDSHGRIDQGGPFPAQVVGGGPASGHGILLVKIPFTIAAVRMTAVVNDLELLCSTIVNGGVDSTGDRMPREPPGGYR
ncbi:hypothetical protein B0H13DRAFT_2329712 [Mycena leptocephala]|nr:hypothetical protein B0H13DRAFT_2329712 [Mycena leptocephala]